MFISGGPDPKVLGMNNCYTFNMATNALERKENMNEARDGHGI